MIAKKFHQVNFYSQCVVNGVTYICEERDQYRKTQNSGVSCQSEGEFFYGVLTAVIELLYEDRMPVHLFMCDWFDTSPGSVNYDRGLTSVNCKRKWYKDSPFIMAVNASQVFYIDDPSKGPGWKVVNHVVQRATFAEATLAYTNTKDPNYEVDQPYQEELALCIPISDIYIDMRGVPRVNIPVDSDEDSAADPNYVEKDDEDEVQGFNNDILSSSSDVDIDDDVSF